MKLSLFALGLMALTIGMAGCSGAGNSQTASSGANDAIGTPPDAEHPQWLVGSWSLSPSGATSDHGAPFSSFSFDAQGNATWINPSGGSASGTWNAYYTRTPWDGTFGNWNVYITETAPVQRNQPWDFDMYVNMSQQTVLTAEDEQFGAYGDYYPVPVAQPPGD